MKKRYDDKSQRFNIEKVSLGESSSRLTIGIEKVSSQKGRKKIPLKNTLNLEVGEVTLIKSYQVKMKKKLKMKKLIVDMILSMKLGRCSLLTELLKRYSDVSF